MGVVFEALDTETDRIVALKTLRQAEPSTVLRFKREFRALADLHHPNLVALHELFYTGGQWYFTMELVDGVGFLDWVRPAAERASRISAQTAATAPLSRETLDIHEAAQPSSRRGTLDEDRLRQALIQLARGLLFLHDADKLHRDIKPSNVLVERDGRVVLCDFGLVLDVSGGEGTPTSPQFTVGTVEYMSPEQSSGARLTPASDWYSVGVVLYRALCGHLPFHGSIDSILARKRALDPLPPSAMTDDEVPPDLGDLAMDLLNRDPRSRPTGGEVLARLGATRGSRRMAVPSTPPFVGRTDELAALRSAYDAVRRGSAAVVFLHGSSGIGKTALASRFLDEIRAQAVVLSGRCYERESVPYKAFDAVVDALSDRLLHLDDAAARALVPADTGTLAYLFPTLRRVDAVLESTLQTADAADRQESRRRAFAALRELLRRFAARSPLVIHIDDLQWGDADSIALLLELVRPPDPPRILIVLAYRSEDAATSPILGRLKQIESWTGSELHASEIRLDPLPSPDARALARELLGTDGDEADAIARESSGSPLFVSELVRYCLSRGSTEPGTLDLDSALRRRLARLSAESRALISVIAVAGRPLALALAGEASRLQLRDAHDALAQLRREYLVRGRGGRQSDAVEVYHDRLREAIVHQLGSDENTRIHRQLAMTLERANHHDAELLFEHWMAAGDRAHAARHALRAADQAAESLAFDRAARLFRLALELGGVREDATSVRVRLAAALAAAGRGRDAADAYLDAAAHADAILRRRCLTDAARLFLLTGEIARGLEVLQGLLADAGAALPRTVPGALLSILWFRLKLGLRGLEWRERPHAAIDADDLARLDVLIAGAEGLGMVDNIRGFELTSRALHRALIVGDRSRLARIFAVEACMAAAPNARGVVRARRIVAELDRMATASDEQGDRVRAITANGVVTYLSGRFAAVAPLLAEADQLYMTLPGEHTLELNMLRLFRLFALRHSGRLTELRKVHDAYLSDADRRGDLYLGTSIRRGNNIVWLIAGRPDRAREELERSSWTPSTTAYHLQHAYFAGARAELAFYQGTIRQLLEEMPTHYRQLDVARSLLMRVQLIRCDSRWMWGRGALLATRLDPRAPAWLLREAKRSARALAREDCGYAGVWSLLLRARIRALAGDVETAAEIWRRAIEAAEAIDMPHHAAAARRRLGELLGGDNGASLVAAGDAWMAGEGIVDAERMTDLYAP